MNILFLSLGSFNSYEQDNIYADILRCAIKEDTACCRCCRGLPKERTK